MNGEDFKRLEQIVFSFKEEVKDEFRHQIGILSEHFQHKLDIVVEGHEVLRKEIKDAREELCEKIKLVDFKLVIRGTQHLFLLGYKGTDLKSVPN